jgi:hypothetical protein
MLPSAIGVACAGLVVAELASFAGGTARLASTVDGAVGLRLPWHAVLRKDADTSVMTAAATLDVMCMSSSPRFRDARAQTEPCETDTSSAHIKARARIATRVPARDLKKVPRSRDESMEP